jgi:hypothetical protein
MSDFYGPTQPYILEDSTPPACGLAGHVETQFKDQGMVRQSDEG